LGEGGGGATVRPAAAQGDVNAEAEGSGLLLGVADAIEEPGGEEG